MGLPMETIILGVIVFVLVIVALVVITVSFGHIYLGTAGVEGTLSSMTTGNVDEAWAKSHHDRWYAEVKAAAADDDETEPAGVASPAGER